MKLLGSLYKKIPAAAPPDAPIPVHTAYAVLMGIVFIAIDRKRKLSPKVATMDKKEAAFCFLFRMLIEATPVISKIPASIRYIHSMSSSFG